MVVYYNGEIQEVYPLQISKVYAVTLLTHAERNEDTTNSSPKEEQLTMEKVKELVAEKEEDLLWNDFEPYMGEDVVSGLYVMHYGINEDYYILVGGGYMEEPPIYVRLVYVKD